MAVLTNSLELGTVLNDVWCCYTCTGALHAGDFSFTPRLLCPQENNPGAHLTGGWIGARAGLGVLEKR